MLRRLILACGTFALILLVYGVYRLRNVPPERTPPNLPDIPLAVASAPATQVGILGSRDIRIAPGHAGEYTVFDAQGRPRYVLEFAEWQPISENEASLRQPKIIIHMPSGQITQIQSETGQVVFELVGKRNVRPKRGWLRGNVKIDIDRTTRRWRQKHPDRQRLQDHPEYIVSVRMDRLFFDSDLSQLSTDGPVKIHTAELDLTTEGLKLTWDQSRNRLQNLDMPNGGIIELRRLAPTPADRPRSAERLDTQPVPIRPAVKASGPAGTGAAASTTAPATQTAPAEFMDEYRATFQGPIAARQYRSDQLVASLDADQILEVVFSFGRRERQVASVDQRPRPAPRTPGPHRRPDQQSGTKLVLTWSGPLKVVPIARRQADSSQRKALFKAVGQAVVLKDQRNAITCNEFIYNAVQRSGRIRATGPVPARISDDRGRYLSGHDIRFDRTAGLLEIVGSGEALEPAGAGLFQPARPTGRPPEQTILRWQDHLIVRFKTSAHAAGPVGQDVFSLARAGSAAGLGSLLGLEVPERSSAGPTGGLVAESAELSGDVFVQQGKESIAADHLLVKFFQPQKKISPFGPIRSARAIGSVKLTGKEQTVSADVLDVTFKLIEPDRSSPIRAVAKGHALASQRGASLAADHIDATLEEIPVPRPGTSGANIPVYLLPRRRQERSRRTRLAVVAVRAAGSVRVADPDQDLDIAAKELEATLPDGSQIKDVLLKGTAEAPAAVAVQDYAISAPHIEADLLAEDLLVPGPGTLRLLVKQGLEGTTLKEPRPLEIRWSNRMQMWGQKNLAVFDKAVQATTEGTAVAAERLTVQFEPLQRSAAQVKDSPVEPTTTLGKVWWQIGRLLAVEPDRLKIRSRNRQARWRSRTRLRRRPIAVIADGNAVTLSSRYDETGKILTSRLRLAGPTFIADLRRRQLQVRGKGTLLVEDYRIAKAAAKLAVSTAKSPPLTAAGASGPGPTQTAFSWVNGMTYVLAERLAIFDGVVHMVHRSGSKVALGEELAQALGANVDLLRTLPGRIATLQCENLIVRFASQTDKQAEPSDLWIERARLQSIAAINNVYLREASRWLTATRLLYSAQTDTFLLEGSPTSKARFFEQDEARGRFVIYTAPWIRYNRRTGKLVAPATSVVSNIQ